MIFYLIRLDFGSISHRISVRINKLMIVHLVVASHSWLISISFPKCHVCDFFRSELHFFFSIVLSWRLCVHFNLFLFFQPTFPTFFHLFLLSIFIIYQTSTNQFFRLFHVFGSTKRRSSDSVYKWTMNNEQKKIIWMNWIIDGTMHDRQKNELLNSFQSGMKLGERSNNWWRDDQ